MTTPLANPCSLRDMLIDFFEQHPVTKAGKLYQGSYLVNPRGYHFIDLFRQENEEVATVIVIQERGHNYKVKAKYGTTRKYETEFNTTQEVIEFIDNFSWKDLPLNGARPTSK